MEQNNAQLREIESRDDLAGWIEQGCKPAADWRIGTEHEKFGFLTDTLKPLPYGGDRGVRAVMEGLMEFGWHPVFEGDNLIALSAPDCCPGSSITLEPGGQFELSGAPLETLHQTCAEVHAHFDQLKADCDRLGIAFLGLGFSPKARLDEIPKMPKGRYGIMSNYMPKVGKLGLEMMYRSATVQVNLDFSSEADMVKKLQVSLALQPVATAIFANSPFTDGKPNGFLSYRSQIWLDTDNARTGMLPFAFKDGMGFERYVDYALDVPMYFVYQGGHYHDVSGCSFRDFMQGKLPGLEGKRPDFKNWEDHLTTLFPEVRLKRYMEMRGADGGPWRNICALPAFWTGLLYDSASLDAAYDMIKDWSEEERDILRREVPRTALKTPFRHGNVRDLALQALEISRAGLKARRRIDSKGADETHFINRLDEIADSGQTPADLLLAKYHGEWNGDIDRVFEDRAY